MDGENEDGKSTETTAGQGEDVSGLKSALSKEREARRKAEQEAKTNSDAAKRLKEAEDAEKSEIDRLKEQLQAAEKRATDAQSESLRSTVALEKGLTATQMKRISGSTREELEADADEYRKEHGLDSSDGESGEGSSGGEDSKNSGDSRRPKETLRPDGSNEEELEENPEKLADAVLKRSRGY